MVKYVYYDAADDEELRLTFCWQTWVVWLVFVAGYTAWHYWMITSASTRPIDWLGFGLHVTVVGLIALVGKTWLDIRNAQYSWERDRTRSVPKQRGSYPHCSFHTTISGSAHTF